MSVTDGDRIAELLLSIDTRLLSQGTDLKEISNRLTRIETMLSQWRGSEERESAAAEIEEPIAPGRRRKPELIALDASVLAVLNGEALGVTEIARAVHRTDRVSEREVSATYAALQRLLRDGRACHHNSQWMRREEVTT